MEPKLGSKKYFLTGKILWSLETNSSTQQQQQQQQQIEQTYRTL